MVTDTISSTSIKLVELLVKSWMMMIKNNNNNCVALTSKLLGKIVLQPNFSKYQNDNNKNLEQQLESTDSCTSWSLLEKSLADTRKESYSQQELVKTFLAVWSFQWRELHLSGVDGSHCLDTILKCKICSPHKTAMPPGEWVAYYSVYHELNHLAIY